MEIAKIEYIRKNNRKKGRKKGVLFCGIDSDDPNSVIVGFSLCNSVDRFDYINGKPVPGFGKETAALRADKWKLNTEYFVQRSYTEAEIDRYEDGELELHQYINPEPQEMVEIPPSVAGKLKVFIQRCKRYYKDKEFPEWIEKFERGEAYPEHQLETKCYVNEFFEIPERI